jgi:hypothetical protein
MSIELTFGPRKTSVKWTGEPRGTVLALDTDRLLAPFRREAGLTTKKPSYENWENTGLDGHYLSALATIIMRA